jgi:hypothetical protein
MTRPLITLVRNRAAGLYYEVMPAHPDEHAERLQRAILAERAPRPRPAPTRTRWERLLDAVDRWLSACLGR